MRLDDAILVGSHHRRIAVRGGRQTAFNLAQAVEARMGDAATDVETPGGYRVGIGLT